MSDFKHIVTTLFGLGIMDERWFTHRFELFEAITLPSVVKQSEEDYTWFIVVDVDMPKQSRDHLDKIVSPFKQVEILPIDPTRPNGLLKERLVHAADTNEWLMTSRIDDDDAIEIHSYERRHESATRFINESRGTQFFMFHPAGIELHLARNEARPFRKHHPYTMGASIISRRDSHINIFHRAHSKFVDFANQNGIEVALLNDDEPMWLYTRHSQADSIRGGRILSEEKEIPISDILLKSYEERFGVSSDKINAYLNESTHRHLQLVTPPHRRSSGLKERNALQVQLKKLHGRQNLGCATEQDLEEIERLREKYVELCRNVYEPGQG